VAKKLTNFIRSPTWITPEFSESLAKDGRDTKFAPEEIERFNKDKKYFLEYRKLVQNTGSSSFSLYYKGSDLQQQSVVKFANLMRERLGYNEELSEKLIPKFPVGCRR
jgi:cation diffusion facilitator CzcD-associated flavoprotein CzcO